MLNFNFSEKGLGLVSPPHLMYNFSRYILLIDQISLSDCFYFLRYWTIKVLQLFVNQAVPSQNLKLILSFESSRFDT